MTNITINELDSAKSAIEFCPTIRHRSFLSWGSRPSVRDLRVLCSIGTPSQQVPVSVSASDNAVHSAPYTTSLQDIGSLCCPPESWT